MGNSFTFNRAGASYERLRDNIPYIARKMRARLKERNINSVYLELSDRISVGNGFGEWWTNIRGVRSVYPDAISAITTAIAALGKEEDDG